MFEGAYMILVDDINCMLPVISANHIALIINLRESVQDVWQGD